jgi:hypothetical protein
MVRTQYIFIDCENVSESALSRVSGKPVRVFMIIGTKHTKLPTSPFLLAQDHPEQVRVIQTPVEGRNAFDFELTLELGRAFAADPYGCFHIVSKDTDFEAGRLDEESEELEQALGFLHQGHQRGLAVVGGIESCLHDPVGGGVHVAGTQVLKSRVWKESQPMVKRVALRPARKT